MILENIHNFISQLHMVGIVPSFLSFILWFSPIFQAIKAHKNKSRYNVSLPFFIISFFNCLAWTIFGIYMNNIYILMANVVGVIIVPITMFVLFQQPVRKCVKYDS